MITLVQHAPRWTADRNVKVYDLTTNFTATKAKHSTIILKTKKTKL